ncbi:MAG: RNA methyltransferase [Acidobacteriota bacterium]
MRDQIKVKPLQALSTGLLAGVSIVLAEPQNPLNIGAVARAMRNFGLSRLRLVRPRAFPHPEAGRMAAGAKRVIEEAQTFDSLAAALLDHTLALAFTRREGKGRRPFLTPEDAARRAIETVIAGGRTALVFGREDHGLSNASLRLCQEVVVIPSDPGCASLNLAHAVALASYEIFLEAARPHLLQRMPRASIAELQALLQHWRSALLAVSFLDPKHPERMMRYFERLFGRAALSPRDVRILRGLAHQMEWAVGRTQQKPRRGRMPARRRGQSA